MTRLRRASQDDGPEPQGPGRGVAGDERLNERVAKLEEHLQYAAAKADIQKLELWAAAGVIGGLPGFLTLV